MSLRYAASSPTRSAAPASVVWHQLLAALFSFEFLFTLFLFSNSLKQILLVSLPVDETIIFAGLTAVAATIVVWRQGIPLRSLVPVLVFLLFLGWVVLSMGWSLSRIVARQYLQYYIVFDLFPLLMAGVVIAADRRRIERFLLLSAIWSILITIFGVNLYFQYGDFKLATRDMEGRTYNTFGYAVAFGSVVWLGMVLFSRLGSRRQLLALLAFLLCFFFLVVSGSRRALLMIAVAALALPLFAGIELGRRRLALRTAQLTMLGLIVLALALIAAAAVQGLKLATLERFISLFAKLETDAVILQPDRIEYWQGAIRAIIEAPVIGHGLAGFNVYMRGMEESGAHPHNLVLELLTNFGFVGLTLFLILLLVGPARMPLSHTDGSIDPLALVIGALFCGTLAASAVGGTLSHQELLFTSLGLTLLARAPAPASRAPIQTLQVMPPAFRRALAATPPIRPLS